MESIRMRMFCVLAVLTVAAITAPVMAAQRKTTPPPAPAPAPAPENVLPPGNVQHGQYLVERVAMCVECHSPRDGAGRIIEGEKYLGGNIPFAPPWPNDWASRAPRNRGLVGYDDKMALRLLTEGSIGREGRQLRSPMPHFFMTRQDAADVIAFLRSAR